VPRRYARGMHAAGGGLDWIRRGIAAINEKIVQRTQAPPAPPATFQPPLRDDGPEHGPGSNYRLIRTELPQLRRPGIAAGQAGLDIAASSRVATLPCALFRCDQELSCVKRAPASCGVDLMRATLLPLWAAVFVAGASATMLFNKIEVPLGAAQHKITAANMAVLGGGTAPKNNDPSNILDGGFWIITNTSGEFPAKLYQSQSWKSITKIGSEEVGRETAGWLVTKVTGRFRALSNGHSAVSCGQAQIGKHCRQRRRWKVAAEAALSSAAAPRRPAAGAAGRRPAAVAAGRATQIPGAPACSHHSCQQCRARVCVAARTAWTACRMHADASSSSSSSSSTQTARQRACCHRATKPVAQPTTPHHPAHPPPAACR
jgi:hypothetical protein